MGHTVYLKNIAQIVSLQKAWEKDGRNLKEEDLSLIEKGHILFDQNSILSCGAGEYQGALPDGVKTYDLEEYIVTPELVDSHTHVVFGGSRSQEYAMRMRGASYEEIASAGGGILSTVQETRKESKRSLFEKALLKLKRMSSYGVKTIEIKSGYGLDRESEWKMLEVIQQLKKELSPQVQILTTYMAAHALPKDFSSSKDYMHTFALPFLEECHQHFSLDFVDIFLEENYFSKQDSIDLFEKAQSLGIKLKVHADEFTNQEGASLACSYKASSCDHLLQISQASIQALAQSSTVATLLPGTGLFLGKAQAPGEKMLKSGVKVAIASDYNPGSCHFENLVTIAQMAIPLYKMNLCQWWAAITLNAAHAVGLRQQGVIKHGMKPRFTFFKTLKHENIPYSWGVNLASSFHL